jgi:hypothetical protein
VELSPVKAPLIGATCPSQYLSIMFAVTNYMVGLAWRLKLHSVITALLSRVVKALVRCLACLCRTQLLFSASDTTSLPA